MGKLAPTWENVHPHGKTCGMQIENDYRVTDAGLELLGPFPLDRAVV